MRSCVNLGMLEPARAAGDPGRRRPSPASSAGPGCSTRSRSSSAAARLAFAQQLIAAGPPLVRGNGAEIAALAPAAMPQPSRERRARSWRARDPGTSSPTALATVQARQRQPADGPGHRRRAAPPRRSPAPSSRSSRTPGGRRRGAPRHGRRRRARGRARARARQLRPGAAWTRSTGSTPTTLVDAGAIAMRPALDLRALRGARPGPLPGPPARRRWRPPPRAAGRRWSSCATRRAAPAPVVTRAREVLAALAPFGVPLLVNDRVDVALAAGAAGRASRPGRHGARGRPPAARARGAILGATVHHAHEADRLDARRSSTMPASARSSPPRARTSRRSADRHRTAWPG